MWLCAQPPAQQNWAKNKVGESDPQERIFPTAVFRWQHPIIAANQFALRELRSHSELFHTENVEHTWPWELLAFFCSSLRPSQPGKSQCHTDYFSTWSCHAEEYKYSTGGEVGPKLCSDWVLFSSLVGGRPAFCKSSLGYFINASLQSPDFFCVIKATKKLYDWKPLLFRVDLDTPLTHSC